MQGDRPRVVLFGMRCPFTMPILSVLADTVHSDLCALVLPRGRSAMSRTGADPVPEIARSHGLQTIELSDRHELTSKKFRTTLEMLAPDLIVVACFPWRLPGWILKLPELGCINVHPSLLPDGRGPEPIFWAFRWGLETTGVTLHQMDEGLDTGPILAQRQLAIPGDATMSTLEQSLAALGSKMLVEMVTGTPILARDSRAQDNSRARYAPFPVSDDLVVPTSWAAARAARFINAATPAYGPIPVLVISTGQRLAVERVISVQAGLAASQPVLANGDQASIRFADGVLHCLLQTTKHSLVMRPRSV
jgi:methionyl-tRNA formyltransferase